jgi:uncharacterized membrane protein YgcG
VTSSRMLQTLGGAIIFGALLYGAPAWCRQWPALEPAVNDLGLMFPPASFDDLTRRLKDFKKDSGYAVSVLTVLSLEDGETVAALATEALHRLPLNPTEIEKALVIAIARRERLVGFAAGAGLEARFPQAETTQKLQSHLDLYIRGLRPDLGIYGGVHFVQGVITGEFRAATTTAEEALENSSIHGNGAGAIFALMLAPFLAFFVSLLLGIYSKHAGFQREIRLFLGIVIGVGTAQLVGVLTGMISPYSDALWYFILGAGIVLGALGSLTEYWMQGDWSGIPRVKDEVQRKPEDNMGI